MTSRRRSGRDLGIEIGASPWEGWDEGDLNIPVTMRQRPASEQRPDNLFDVAAGYRVGDVLLCKADETVYACVDASVGDARWLPYHQAMTPDMGDLSKRVRALLEKYDRGELSLKEGWDDPLFEEED